MENQIFLPLTGRKRVVVIGGGFAGLATIKALKKKNLQIVLIDKNNYHQFQPLLYQVATSGLEPTSICFPLRRIFKKYDDFHYLMAVVRSVDTQKSVIYTSVGHLSFDYLVIAAGSNTNYFGMQDIRQHSYSLKSISEALALRNMIFKSLEKATYISERNLQAEYLNFVIVGGGATGVELAGAIAELKNKVLPEDFPEIDFSAMKIYLLNATERLLEAFSLQSSRRTLNDLTKMGVTVMLNATVEHYTGTEITYNKDKKIISRNLIWTSGVIANRIEGINALGRGARILTDSHCRVFLHDEKNVFSNIFAIGDIALIKDKPPLPQVAQPAIQQGRYVGHNLLRSDKTAPFRYRNKGSMATIGRNKAVTELGRYRFAGFTAWLLWLFVHLMYIVGFRNRLLVMWNWGWNYFAHDQPLRSIIEVKRRKSSDT